MKSSLKKLVVVCVIRIECRDFFSSVLSNLMKLCYADYGGFQILGRLRRNNRIKKSICSRKCASFVLPISRISLSPIFLSLVLPR